MYEEAPTRSLLSMLKDEEPGIESLAEDVVKADDIKHFVMRKNMIDANNINREIYDTESYYREDKNPWEEKQKVRVAYTKDFSFLFLGEDYYYQGEDPELDAVGHELTLSGSMATRTNDFRDALEQDGYTVVREKDMDGEYSILYITNYEKGKYPAYGEGCEVKVLNKYRRTDLFDIDFGQDEVYVEALKHNYEKEDYEYTLHAEEIPHFNMPWRNAIGFLGRIIVNGEIKYKGLITLQYDGERHNIIIVKPHQVNYATFSHIPDEDREPTIAYNALDPLPFIFEDLLGEEGDAFTQPVVLGVIPYNIPFRIPYPDERAKYAKTFTSFDSRQLMFLRPYFAIPAMPQLIKDHHIPGLFRMRLNLRIGDDEKGENYLLANTIDEDGRPVVNWRSPNLIQFLYRTFDLSNAHNKPIRMTLITEAIDNETFESTDQYRVPISAMFVEDTFEILHNLSKQIDEEPLEYYVDVVTTTKNPTEEAEFREYHSDIHISRKVPILDEDGELEEYETKDVRRTKVWTNHDPAGLIEEGVLFEGINFRIRLGRKTSPESTFFNVDNMFDAKVTIDAELKFRKTHTGTTQNLIVRGEKLLDPQDMLKHHRLKEATMVHNLDRFGILYGPHVGSNFLQFLAYDQLDHAPFPFYSVDFDTEITHIHSHRNNLYVFTQSGLYILHEFISPLHFRKTFAYANVNLDPAEKNTVVSFGNEVFYISDGVGYAIRTNIHVESEDDVYVQPVTQPIDSLLKHPAPHIKQRLEEGYGKVIDTHEDLKVSYHTKAANSHLYIFASYHVEDASIMVAYIFDKDHKRWTMYDTIAGAQPIVDVVSGGAKGFDLVLKNKLKGGYTTYASFVRSLPTEATSKYIGDVSVVKRDDDEVVYDLYEREDEPPIYNLKPLSVMFDTGSLGFNQMHTKKVRRILLNLMDMRGDGIDVYMVPHMDHKDYQNRLNVEVALGEDEEYTADYLENVNTIGYSPMLPIITPQNLPQEGFRLSISELNSTRKTSLLTQMNTRGKMPGFRFYVFAHDQFKIGDYGIVYRQQKAR